MLKWQIYIISVSHQNQNNGLPCCSTPRRISFLYFVLIQTSLHEGDAWYHFVVIFTCLLLILYFICNSMAINLIWIELKLNAVLSWLYSTANTFCKFLNHDDVIRWLFVLCVGNSPVTGEFPAQRLVTPSFDVFLDLRLNKRLSKQ